MVRLLALLFVDRGGALPGRRTGPRGPRPGRPGGRPGAPSAPRMVHLRFNEPVRPLVVRLFEAGGRMLQDLAVERHDETVMVTMPPDLGTGSHVLSYRVISTDGHPVAGSLTFSVGQAGSGARCARPTRTPAARDSSSGSAASSLYAGLFVGVGGAFFRAWLTPDLRDRATTGLLDRRARSRRPGGLGGARPSGPRRPRQTVAGS